MPQEDRWLSRWLLLSLAAACLMSGVNAVGFHFTGIFYYPRQFLLALLALPVAYCGRCHRVLPERVSFVLRNGALYVLALAALDAMVTGMQFTPFAPFDLALQRWDRALGFDTVALLRWTAARPRLRDFLGSCYDSTSIQLMLAPLAAGIAQDRRRMRVFLYAMVYSALAGCLFYYFCPSSGPATVYASPDFLSIQRLTSLKFYQVHHSQKLTTMDGGMCAFPSFHVAWSVLLSYSALPYKWLFYPVSALNVLAIASTVLLGWHYLVDVPAGIVLAALSLAAAARTDDRFAAGGAV